MVVLTKFKSYSNIFIVKSSLSFPLWLINQKLFVFLPIYWNSPFESRKLAVSILKSFNFSSYLCQQSSLTFPIETFCTNVGKPLHTDVSQQMKAISSDTMSQTRRFCAIQFTADVPRGSPCVLNTFCPWNPLIEPPSTSISYPYFYLYSEHFYFCQKGEKMLALMVVNCSLFFSICSLFSEKEIT